MADRTELCGQGALGVESYGWASIDFQQESTRPTVANENITVHDHENVGNVAVRRDVLEMLEESGISDPEIVRALQGAVYRSDQMEFLVSIVESSRP